MDEDQLANVGLVVAVQKQNIRIGTQQSFPDIQVHYLETKQNGKPNSSE